MVNKAKRLSETDGRAYLRSALIDVERHFRVGLETKASPQTHDAVMGGVVEDHWIWLLRRYLPRRYVVDSAFVVDREGQTSLQLDSVVFDAHFTPALFGEAKHRYVPAEAVYATFEIKPTVDKSNLETASDKLESVRRLNRTSVSIVSAGEPVQAREPFPIIGGLLAREAAWQDGLGSTFLEHFTKGRHDRRLDMVLTVNAGFAERFSDDEKVIRWHHEGSLVHGLFRLLRALQGLGTVPAIDWAAYASVFEDA